MNDDFQNKTDRVDPPNDFNTLAIVRSFASLVLLGFGLCAGIWLLISIAGTLSSEKPPGIISNFLPAQAEAVELEAEGEAVSVKLPKQLFVVAGYFVVCLLYFVAGSLVKTALAGGISLLQRSTKTTRRR